MVALIYMREIGNVSRQLCEISAGGLCGIICMSTVWYGVRKWLHYRRESLYYRGLCDSLLHFQRSTSSEHKA